MEEGASRAGVGGRSSCSVLGRREVAVGMGMRLGSEMLGRGRERGRRGRRGRRSR